LYHLTNETLVSYMISCWTNSSILYRWSM